MPMYNKYDGPKCFHSLYTYCSVDVSKLKLMHYIFRFVN